MKSHREIQLSQGRKALVDEQDYERVSALKWNLQKNNNVRNRDIFYAKHHSVNDKGNRTSLLMHRLITNAPSDKEVDHINGDGLDNRRSNLRLTSKADNQRNSYLHRSGKPVGVRYDKKSKRYKARSSHNGKEVHLGTFFCEEDAKKAVSDFYQNHHG